MVMLMMMSRLMKRSERIFLLTKCQICAMCTNNANERVRMSAYTLQNKTNINHSGPVRPPPKPITRVCKRPNAKLATHHSAACSFRSGVESRQAPFKWVAGHTKYHTCSHSQHTLYTFSSESTSRAHQHPKHTHTKEIDRAGNNCETVTSHQPQSAKHSRKTIYE